MLITLSMVHKDVDDVDIFKQRMTLSDLEWPFHGSSTVSCAISAIAELFV